MTYKYTGSESKAKNGINNQFLCHFNLIINLNQKNITRRNE